MKAGGKRPPAGLCEGPDPGESCGDGTNAKASLPPGGTPARGRPGDTDHRIALAIGLRNQGGDDILAVKLDREDIVAPLIAKADRQRDAVISVAGPASGRRASRRQAGLGVGPVPAAFPGVGAFAEPRRRSFSAGLHMKLTRFRAS